MTLDYQDETKEKSLERIFTELATEGEIPYKAVTYIKSNPDHLDFDTSVALDTDTFIQFIRSSQPKKYKALGLRAQNTTHVKLIDGFQHSVEAQGLLSVLKHGFDVLGIHFRAFFAEPEDKTDLEAMQLFKENRFYCARQFHYSKVETKKSIDIVLLINGIPIIAIEVKTPFTGQSSDDAVTQFCTDRDQSELFFRLNRRCLVMFAVDNYDVQMTTYLNGLDTIFIPFNQGSNGPGEKGGKGNPIIPDVVPTHYLFDEVLRPSNISRILVDFMTYEDDDIHPKVIFPRYHQMNCVNYFSELALTEGPGHSYLVQHSAGSGKSNTIAWLAFRLLYLHNLGESVFDSVIICVHRTVLNEQLNTTVPLFEYSSNTVALVNSSKELREALSNGNKVIVTTIQKFGQINESLKLYKRNFAIIFDEAHTTTTGKLNKKTKLALGIRELKDDEHDILAADYSTEEEILKAYEKIRCEGSQDNMSFYAFTATPTEKTLHAFGKCLPNGEYDAHHHYCMRQAIEEGFICNVLEDFHSYQGYFDMMKKVADSNDPMVDKTKAKKILKNMERKDPRIIMKKARVIVDFFHEYVINDLNGHAKAMIVVEGRENVLNYRDALIEASKEAGYEDIRSMVAFSGSLNYNGDSVREIDFNFVNGKKVKSREMSKVFDTDTFNLMIAADKFQVGFDQPKLTTMFVDKVLTGVEAVQTLSRLNRTIRGVEKHTHVLDFRNTDEDIREAFEPYYLDTKTEENYDPTYIYKRRQEIEAMGVIVKEEVVRFANDFKSTDPNAQKKLPALLEPARQRFILLPEETQTKFRKAARGLQSQYGSVTVANNFMDPYFHDLVQFIHYLLRVLPKKPTDPMPDIEKIVSLDHYRLVSKGNTSITLSEGDPLANPADRLILRLPSQDYLTEIVRKMNQRWGLPDFNDADKLAFSKGATADIQREISKTGDIHEFAEWTGETFDKQFHDIAKVAVINRAMNDQNFFNALLNDPTAIDTITSDLLRAVHYSIKHKEKEDNPQE